MPEEKDNKKSLDDKLNTMFNDTNPQADAVNALIKVGPRAAGVMDTEIELKTDLSEDEVKLHTAVDMLSAFLEMTPTEFKKKSVISQLVNKKERKSLSKNRKSREEIVAVAKNPDTIMEQQPGVSQNFIKKFFTSQKKQI